MEIVAKQLGHSDTKTVATTYGHLAEHYREAQIRERFTPLDAAQEREASLRCNQLNALLEKHHQGHWREYAKVIDVTSRPSRPVVQTHKSVLEVFGYG